MRRRRKRPGKMTSFTLPWRALWGDKEHFGNTTETIILSGRDTPGNAERRSYLANKSFILEKPTETAERHTAIYILCTNTLSRSLIKASLTTSATRQDVPKGTWHLVEDVVHLNDCSIDSWRLLVELLEIVNVSILLEIPQNDIHGDEQWELFRKLNVLAIVSNVGNYLRYKLIFAVALRAGFVVYIICVECDEKSSNWLQKLSISIC